MHLVDSHYVVYLSGMKLDLLFLCNDISRLARKRFGEEARKLKLPATGAQWRVLVALERLPGISQGELAEQLDVVPFSAGRMVDRLVVSGLVERRPNPHDRRAWQLFLTDRGRPVAATMQELGQTMIDGFMPELSDEDVEQALALLTKARDALLMTKYPNENGKVVD